MLRIVPSIGPSILPRIGPRIGSSMIVNSMMNQDSNHNRGMDSTGFAQMEKKVYQERNGQVIDDKYIKETIADGKMKVEGYDNGKPIYFVKEFGNKVLRTEPKKVLRKKPRKTVKQIKKKRRLTKSKSRK